MRRRVIILLNAAKHDARAVMASLAETVGRQAEVVGTGTLEEAGRLLALRPDRTVVMGGDGSILAVAHAMGDRQTPIVGVNFGKLGFLAEFSVDDFKTHLPAILDDPAIVSRRMMLDGVLTSTTGAVSRFLGVNDCVVHAGPPFRMIEVSISVNGDHLTNFSGDGLVIATPTGSTAHNMSLGGPIVQSEVPAIILSPIAPHSLTHRPLVVGGQSVIEVHVRQANAGTMMVLDGQVTAPLAVGDQLLIKRFTQDFQLVHNPAQPHWFTLTKKIKWGQ